MMLYSAFMLLIGSYEACSRPAYTYQVSLTLNSGASMQHRQAFLTYAATLRSPLQPQPLWLTLTGTHALLRLPPHCPHGPPSEPPLLPCCS